MKNLVWFLFGVIGGFAVAHLVNKDPRGQEVLAQVDARIGEFADRMGDAYRDQEAKFAGSIDGAKDAAASALSSAKDAASDVLDQAKSAAAQAVDTVKDVAGDVTGAAKDAASDVTDAATDAVESAEDAVKDAEDTASDVAADAKDTASEVPTPKDVAEHTSVPDVSALADDAESESDAAKN